MAAKSKKTAAASAEPTKPGERTSKASVKETVAKIKKAWEHGRKRVINGRPETGNEVAARLALENPPIKKSTAHYYVKLRSDYPTKASLRAPIDSFELEKCNIGFTHMLRLMSCHKDDRQRAIERARDENLPVQAMESSSRR